MLLVYDTCQQPVICSPFDLDSQHSDIPKDTLKGLVKYIAHFVFKVLRSNKRIEQVAP